MPEALITAYFFFLSLGGNGKIDSQPFFLHRSKSQSFVLSFFRHVTCSSLHPMASLDSLDQI